MSTLPQSKIPRLWWRKRCAEFAKWPAVRHQDGVRIERPTKLSLWPPRFCKHANLYPRCSYERNRGYVSNSTLYVRLGMSISMQSILRDQRGSDCIQYYTALHIHCFIFHSLCTHTTSLQIFMRSSHMYISKALKSRIFCVSVMADSRSVCKNRVFQTLRTRQYRHS